MYTAADPSNSNSSACPFSTSVWWLGLFGSEGRFYLNMCFYFAIALGLQIGFSLATVEIDFFF